MLQAFRSLARDESGATAIEYALLAALISIALISAFFALGLELDDVFGTIFSTLDDANPNN